jgi:hypothetical protein
MNGVGYRLGLCHGILERAAAGAIVAKAEAGRVCLCLLQNETMTMQEGQKTAPKQAIDALPFTVSAA